MCLSSLKNWWDWKTILSCWKCPHFWGDILIFRGLFGWTFIFCISLKWSLFGEDPIILRQIHCGCVSKLKGSESPNLIGFPIKGVHFQNFKVFKVFSDIFTKNRWFVVGCINFPLSLVNFQPQKKTKSLEILCFHSSQIFNFREISPNHEEVSGRKRIFPWPGIGPDRRVLPWGGRFGEELIKTSTDVPLFIVWMVLFYFF